MPLCKGFELLSERKKMSDVCLNRSEPMTEQDRLIEAINKARKLHEQLGAALDELEQVANAKPTTGQQAKKLLDLFGALWRKRYPTQRFVVNGAKDVAMLKRLLGSLPEVDIAIRMDRFFRSTDPFFGEARHTLPLFIGSINKLAAEAPAGTMPRTVIGCRHDPRCTTPQEHTRKQLDETRR